MHVIELLPAYALGCLDAEEAAEVSEHLARCASCRAQLHAYQAVADQLALAAPDAAPAAGVKLRLMQRTQGVRTARAASHPRSRWEVLASLFRRTAPAWGLASLVLIVALAAGVVWLWGQTHLKTQRVAGMQLVALAATEAAPGATGTLVISSGGDYGTLVVDGLPPLEVAHQYQVWLIRDGKRQSGGVFSVNTYGYGAIEITAPEPLSHYSSFFVTLEPAGGSATPTGEQVLAGKQ